MLKITCLFCGLLFVSAIVRGQEIEDVDTPLFHASGTLNVTTNGISDIPAYSLGKPAVRMFLSLRYKRFSFDPDMAFSLNCLPWFFGNNFRYLLIEKPAFQFRTGITLGIGYSYPEIRLDGSLQDIAKAERSLWLELIPEYKLSDKVTLGSVTYIGYNFEPVEVKQINYFSVNASISQIRVYNEIYSRMNTQMFYLDNDGTDGLFISGILGVGHHSYPFILSTQINQTITTTILPDPEFTWNVSLSYNF